MVKQVWHEISGHGIFILTVWNLIFLSWKIYFCFKVDRHLRKLDQELAKFKMELEADCAGITERLEKRMYFKSYHWNIPLVAHAQLNSTQLYFVFTGLPAGVAWDNGSLFLSFISLPDFFPSSDCPLFQCVLFLASISKFLQSLPNIALFTSDFLDFSIF